MPKSLNSSATLTLLTSFLAFSSVSCDRSLVSVPKSDSNKAPTEQVNTATATLGGSLQTPSPNKTSGQPPLADSYHQAIERASSAYSIGQSAESRDDWRLVVNRWQQAIDLMKAVPVVSPYHSQMGRKLVEYRRNLAYAQQQASRPTTNPNPGGVVVLPPHPSISSPTVAALPIQTPVPSNEGVFYAPIIRRAGSTPRHPGNFQWQSAI
jgi:hypothetical protein